MQSLFKPGAKINQDHKHKYIHILAYAASVVETWKKVLSVLRTCGHSDQWPPQLWYSVGIWAARDLEPTELREYLYHCARASESPVPAGVVWHLLH